MSAEARERISELIEEADAHKPNENHEMCIASLREVLTILEEEKVDVIAILLVEQGKGADTQKTTVNVEQIGEVEVEILKGANLRSRSTKQ